MKSQTNQAKLFFSLGEDQLLIALVNRYGPNRWMEVSKEMRTRTARQCRDRWRRYLDPHLKCSEWTYEDDEKLKELYSVFGSQWKKIGELMGNRSDLSIKNRFFVLAHRWRENGISMNLPLKKYAFKKVYGNSYLKIFENSTKKISTNLIGPVEPPRVGINEHKNQSTLFELLVDQNDEIRKSRELKIKISHQINSLKF
jgi:hypothetical protein